METDELSSVTAQEMRNQLSDLLNRASYLKEATLVTRQGKTVAVLISVEDWEEYLQMKTTAEKREAENAGHTAERGRMVAAQTMEENDTIADSLGTSFIRRTKIP